MNAYEQYLASNPEQCCVCKRAFSAELPAITKEFTGEYYSFCSAACIAGFEQDPEKFARFADDEDEE